MAGNMTDVAATAAASRGNVVAFPAIACYSLKACNTAAFARRCIVQGGIKCKTHHSLFPGFVKETIMQSENMAKSVVTFLVYRLSTLLNGGQKLLENFQEGIVYIRDEFEKKNECFLESS
ncbi:hypothetical protein RND71_025242 [Anisodus tanguticus]|uniref:Uncharacterized protein n=1 Tax=Anisodus tanguticus TaxID=243964 RepID=A0AAE1RSK6_9SOLA|nr:hypothetical protein RND71_025242 [Anisodus tanguticus]